MGMDIPIVTTPALKQFTNDIKRVRRRCSDNVLPKFEPLVPFVVQLEAAKDRVLAYKDYFYDRDLPVYKKKRAPEMCISPLLDKEEEVPEATII